MACLYYNVTITQTDLDAASAVGSSVRVDYYPCPGGILTPKFYFSADTFTNDFCNDESQGFASQPYWIDGLTTYGSSSSTATLTPCGDEITPTVTPTISETPTSTPPIVSIQCDDYFNNTGNPLTGINYVDCDNVSQTNVTVNPGQSICVQQGTLNGGDSGFLTNLGSCGVYPPVTTETPTPTQTPTQTSTPTQTPTPTTTPSSTETPTPSVTPSTTPTTTQTSTQASTPTVTPTQTATPSVTASNTPTPSITPTTTTIYCLSGLTQSSYGYYDCCGTFVSGTGAGVTIIYNPQRTPLFGITSLGSVATTICSTATPTPTPSVTSTLTSTPTPTPTIALSTTPTPSPTTTPAPTQVITLQNNCTVFTLFDMGVSCRTLVQPSNLNSFDGALTLDITGGTSPYSIYWADSNSKTATRTGLKEGIYEAVVVDFYGDYSATTFCSLEALVPSPTPTSTVTPTPSSQPVYPSLCVLITGLVPALPPIQFTYNGLVSGRPIWVYGSYTMSWNVQNQRWQINGLTVNGGTVVSTTTSTPPLSNWTVVGGNVTPIPQVIVIEGICPTYTPMTVIINSENSDCGNDGSISITTSGGLPPYQYSINGGATYTTSSVFNGLSANTYNVVVKDTSGSTIQRSVVITQTGIPTTYSLSISNTNLQNLSRNLRRATWQVNVNPSIPVGTTLNFVMNVETIQDVNAPGSGITSSVNQVYLGSTLLSPTTTNTTSSESGRLNCSPFTTQTTNIIQTYNITMSAGTVVSGVIDSSLVITSGSSSSNGCVTNLLQEISVLPLQGIVNGCQCCTVNTNSVSYGGLSHTLSFGQGGATQNYTQVVLGIGNLTTTACADETTSTLRIINAPSFGVGVTIFTGDISSPLPLLGYTYCSYQTGLYNVDPLTGQVTGAVLSPGGTQVFC